MQKSQKPLRYGTLQFIENEKGQLLFEKRPEKGLLGGMVGIPGTDWTEEKVQQQDIIKNFQVNHTFTHFHLSLNGMSFIDYEKNYINNRYFWCDIKDYDNIGLPTVFKKALKQYIKIKNL